MLKYYFNFQHDYYKLNWDEFTTIRGKTAAKHYEIYQVVELTKEYEFYCNAVIYGIITAPISEFKLDTLKKDAEYPGFQIHSYQDFVDLINSFNPPYYKQATVDSEKTLFQLKKHEIGNDLILKDRVILKEMLVTSK